MKKIKNIIIFFSLHSVLSMILFAQSKKVDSLLNVLKIAKEDTNKINVLNALSWGLWRTANSSAGIKYAEEAILLAKKLNFKPGLEDAYVNIGAHYQYQGNYPEALKNFYTALNLAEEMKAKVLIADCYLFLGAIYSEQGRSYSSASLRKELFDEALKNDFASLKIYQELGNKFGSLMCYNDIGVVYRNQGNFSEALRIFFVSRQLAEDIGAKRDIAIADINIGSAYWNMGDYPKALEKSFAAVKIAEEIGDKRDLSDGYETIGEIYFDLKDYSKARKYLGKGLSVATEIGNKEVIIPCYQILSQLDSAEKKWENAYTNHKLSALYQDSLINEENSKKFIQTQMQYEFNKKEDSLKQKQLLTEIKVQTQAKQKNFYLIGAILFALLFVFVFLNFRNQRKVNRLMDVTYAKEKAELELHSLRAQLNPHFMFNSMNAIQELILREDFDNSHTFLARFAKLVRMLLENAEKPFVPLNSEIDFLELYLSLEKLRIPDLNFSIIVDPLVNTGETLLPNMVLQPYIENALWHGLSQKAGDKNLELIIHKQEGAIVYNVKDNGVGRKKAAEFKSLYRKEHKSKGMELLTKRFKLLNEEFGSEIRTEVSDVMINEEVGGTLVSIYVPNSISANAKNFLQ